VATIKLFALAQAAGVPLRTLERWTDSGLVRGVNRGRGRGRGITLSREAATEALAFVVLRNAGVPLQRVRSVARGLRSAGKAGRDFLAVGADGRTVLLDGAGDGAPLRDPGTGQTYLGIVLDLRPMRAEIERLVEQLEGEPS
jgi:hypothetical protein